MCCRRQRVSTKLASAFLLLKEIKRKFALSMSFFQNKKNIKYKNSMTGVPMHKRENDDNGNDNDGDNCCIVICGYYGGKKGCLMDV